MSVVTTTYGDINQRTAYYAIAEMLSHAEPVIILGRFGLQKPMPMNKANQAKFRRPIPFPISATPLAEGVTPNAQKMLYEDVAVVMRQYGDWVAITDVVLDMAEDPVLADATVLCGEQAAGTIELVTYGILKAGTSVYYANGTQRSDVNTPVTLALQRRVTAFLKRMKGKKITKILSPSPNFGTRAVEASYVAVTHSDVESDIRGMAGFIPVADYGTRSPLCDEEIGTVEDVRYVLSPDLAPFADAGGTKAGSGVTMISTSGTSADVYPIIYLAKEAFGVVPLKGKSAITPMVVNPKPSVSDPLAQRGSVGWKTYFAAVILNQTWLARAEVAVTA